ncbi:protein kinase [Streptomyces poonensis]|uniref:protein kinase n=1 Tax=Streptomyces poonensis TaxID=68255 RepID=UPI00167943B5|nr:protein kinase [Streptomyces poonensis]
MDDYAGRVLADRYRLPLPPSDEYELAESRAFDTYSGQEVLVRQVPLPEVVEAEVLDADGLPEGYVARDGGARRSTARTTRRPVDPAVRRAIEAAQAAAQIPDHPRLDQVFDVFAEGGSLWIVSELVSARPLAALLAEEPLTPYRAAEIAADVLTALRALHAHGWVHRNVTSRTVLVCDDGRVVLTGLASGAAEEALCGYDPVPARDPQDEDGPDAPGGGAGPDGGFDQRSEPGFDQRPDPGFGRGPDRGSDRGLDRGSDRGTDHGLDRALDRGRGRGPDGGYGSVGSRGLELPTSRSGAAEAGAADPEAARRAAIEARAGDAGPGRDPSTGQRILDTGGDVRAARAGAIAAYRAGARAAARVNEGQGDRQGTPLPGQRPVPGSPPGMTPGMTSGMTPGEVSGAAPGTTPGVPGPTPGGTGATPGSGAQPASTPPGQIADPYGVGRSNPWHGATPRPGVPAPVTGPQGSGSHRGGGSVSGGGSAGGSGGGSARPALPGAHATGASGSAAPSAVPAAAPAASSWDQLVGGGAAHRGPTTALAAERARQARMAVVGPVTERWAPEQAGPVHENWQLAAPIGPATDLWALGALLFRAVQGHAPYPEENTAELVQMVCSEPPAYAEECGPLRPVVESLLRQDPTDRPDIEELRGWLRSLVRSAPEPEAGMHVVAAPPADPRRLPIKRRRGELVRRRRRNRMTAAHPHGRHKRASQERAATEPVEPSGPSKLSKASKPSRAPKARKSSMPSSVASMPSVSSRSSGASRAPKWSEPVTSVGPSQRSGPRTLGRNLLLLVLLALVAAITYAVMFMPKAGTDGSSGTDTDRTGASGNAGPGPAPEDSGAARPEQSAQEEDDTEPSETSASTRPQGNEPKIVQGFTLRDDPEGFRIAVANGWDRTARNGRGQVVYSQGRFELIVVPGRDSAETFGSDPLAYQREDERELQPFRDSTWATSSGMRLIEVGGRSMAEGQFTWQDADGREMFVRNLAILVDGRYHVVQVRGPEAERDEVTRLYEQAQGTYQVTD